MLTIYNYKIVKSGEEIEVYDYRTKNMLRGYKRRKRTKLKPRQIIKKIQLEQDEIEQLDMYKYGKEVKAKDDELKNKAESSIRRTKTNIKRIANSNPQLKKFLTLTFAESTTDLTKANRLFHLAMKRVFHGKPEFGYLAIVEYQKDTDYFGKVKPEGGSVHYHLLCKIETILDRTPFEWERWFQKRYWRYGFVKIKEVKTVKNMGAYFCKYLGKDIEDKRMFGRKKYFCSRGLKRPDELFGNEAIMFYYKFLKELKPGFEKTYKGDWTGTVDYSTYSLKNVNLTTFGTATCQKDKI